MQVIRIHEVVLVEQRELGFIGKDEYNAGVCIEKNFFP